MESQSDPAQQATDFDPKPKPPHQPNLDACCGNGCDPCIFDLHDLAMDQYRQELRAWRARQSGGSQS
ncbi:oxidoreductase-like domain-containing protein [Paucibacter sp. Y2R2-4]|uniref:oxidoreductase-like domain-containing protein n=1 Tax=Paucibacter sp. Y2R2-4 TaxID=2893553 RepID=UPI0021E4058F|nr:oxidoreductase-like domain-containing protein [Paucibacter sp. Y2R2-4]MCV2351240.1 oxidoreductase-like domain-containing protein [Paucibacter sp. Y2R2-4]